MASQWAIVVADDPVLDGRSERARAGHGPDASVDPVARWSGPLSQGRAPIGPLAQPSRDGDGPSASWSARAERSRDDGRQSAGRAPCG